MVPLRGILIKKILILICLVSGCNDVGTIKQEIDELKTEVSAFKKEQNAGGDINDPIASWIMAATMPVGLLGYLISHRVPVLRKLKDKIKGK